jgi:hypothetical protein
MIWPTRGPLDNRDPDVDVAEAENIVLDIILARTLPNDVRYGGLAAVTLRAILARTAAAFLRMRPTIMATLTAMICSAIDDVTNDLFST